MEGDDRQSELVAEQQEHVRVERLRHQRVVGGRLVRRRVPQAKQRRALGQLLGARHEAEQRVAGETPLIAAGARHPVDGQNIGQPEASGQVHLAVVG